MREFFLKIRNNNFFEGFIISIILISAVFVGFRTYDEVFNPEIFLYISYLDYFVTIIFVIEIIIRMVAEKSLIDFFKEPWNIFDFLIVSISLIPIESLDSVLLARLVRVFRLLRLVSFIPQFRILIESFITAIPRVGYILLFMFVEFYIFAALGSILFGFATPTEAAGCGAMGALLLSLAYKKLTLSKLQEALVKTLEITALIMVLVAASNFFGAVFARLGTPTLLTEFLLGLEMNKYLILAMIMVMIFLLGWPLEWVPIVMIIIPIILPLVEALGFNLTWFAILVAVNLQTAWLSPPVALSAYFLKGVVPEWDLKDIYFGMMQFMVLQIIGLVLIVLFPQIALWLPTLLYGS